MLKTIRVSDENWKALQKIRIERGYRSLDQVVSFLLEKYNQYLKQTLNEVLQSLEGTKKGQGTRA